MKLSAFLRELGQPVAYYPKLAQVTGGVLANLFLCQMYYWQSKQDDPNGWIYKTQAEIEAETELSRREQETARQLLRQRDLLKERYKGLPRRLEFWLDEDELENRWCFFLEYKAEKLLLENNKQAQTRHRNSTRKAPQDSKELSSYEPPESSLYNDLSATTPMNINACPVTPNNNAQTPQAVMVDVDKLACRIPTGNPHTEITTENTNRDYNTYPPNPPERREGQPSEWVLHQNVEKSFEVESPDNLACEDQTLAKTFCLERTNPAGDNCSAARRENKNRYQRNQPEYPKNLDGSDCLPWDTNKRGVFDPEFEKHMARSLMQYPAYQNLMFGELVTKVRKHISASRYDLRRRDELLIEWEAMQAGHTADIFSSSTSSLTAKAAARRAKIARALSMEVS